VCAPQWSGADCAQCANSWTGENCDTCPEHWTGFDCDQCSNAWSGADCDTCPANFTGTSCDQCANPNMDIPGCTVCQPQFTGTDCDQCANPNKALPDCDTCVLGVMGDDCDQYQYQLVVGRIHIYGQTTAGLWQKVVSATYTDNSPYLNGECTDCTLENTCACSAANSKCNTPINGGTLIGSYCVDEPVSFTQVHVGDGHFCGLDADGLATCVGENYQGAIECDPWFSNPGECISTDLTQPFQSIGGGYDFTCGIRTDQSVDCWGSGYEPYPESLPTFPVAHLAFGAFHGCAISAIDGHAECWGDSSWDCMPTGSCPKDEPHSKSASLAGPFASLSISQKHICALTTAGTITCWGKNLQGQCDAPEGQFTTVTAAYDYSCALDLNQDAVCWGAQNGLTKQSNVVHAGPFVQLISQAFHDTCGLRTDGSVQCWKDSGDLALTAP
jgi:hypothetical protein